MDLLYALHETETAFMNQYALSRCIRLLPLEPKSVRKLNVWRFSEKTVPRCRLHAVEDVYLTHLQLAAAAAAVLRR
jgi:hypothetical protein